MSPDQRERALRLADELEAASNNVRSVAHRAAALLRELAAEPIAAPRGSEPTKPINVVIDVPINWESRFDMQWIIEREIKADRWLWRWPTSEPVRVPMTDDAATNLVQQCVSSSPRPIGMVEFGLVVLRQTEAAHGITGDAK